MSKQAEAKLTKKGDAEEYSRSKQKWTRQSTTELKQRTRRAKRKRRSWWTTQPEKEMVKR